MLVDGVFWLVPQDLRIIISQRSRYRIITQRGVAVLPTMVESPPTHGDLSGAGYKKLMSSVPIFILQHQHPFSVAMRFTLTLLGSLILFVAGLVQETNAQNPPVPGPKDALDVSHCSWCPAESKAHCLPLPSSVEEGSRPRCFPNWFHHLIRGEGPASLQQR